MKAIKVVISGTILSLVFLISCTKTDTGNAGDYSVFAWNDLGMHCLNASYDKLVILPPYNNVIAQVIKKGAAPEIVTAGLSVSYKIINNTTSANKRSYGGFWEFANKLFGVTPELNKGLTGNGLSGDMTRLDDHFIAEGIPVVPVDDNNTWNPYQVAEITVKDDNGNILAQTRATVPTSDEINCAKCHGANAFTDILSKHDSEHGTSLSLAANQPVLCAKCHPSPALGINTGPQMYLSQAIHGSHSSRGASCYDCHPGATTRCSRSIAHTSDNGNCTTCHGTMSVVASSIGSGRIPWASEPSCSSCHDGVSGVNTGNVLFRNAKGHGDLYCSVCHGSPHAMYPSRETTDNYQPEQYQGSKIKTIGSCGVCHSSSRGENDISEFSEVHGGTNPEKSIGCRACHTSIPSVTSNWPHAFTWKNSN